MLFRFLPRKRVFGSLPRGGPAPSVMIHPEDIWIEYEEEILDRTVVQCPDILRLPVYFLSLFFLSGFLVILVAEISSPQPINDAGIFVLLLTLALGLFLLLIPHRPITVTQSNPDGLRGSDAAKTVRIQLSQDRRKLTASAFANPAVRVSPVLIAKPGTNNKIEFGPETNYAIWMQTRGWTRTVPVLIGIAADQELAERAAHKLCSSTEGLGAPVRTKQSVKIVPCPHGPTCPYRRKRLKHLSTKSMN